MRVGASVSAAPERSNDQQKSTARLLLIAPWLTTGGADRFNLEFIRQLSLRGWSTSIVTTEEGDHSWLPLFEPFAVEIHALAGSLRFSDYPAFLIDTIRRLQIDVVLISHSETAYALLPLLRATLPGTAFADYCHVIEPDWNRGGYPRLAVTRQSVLDLSLVSSQHLKDWMVRAGADSARIDVVYTGADIDADAADPALRVRVRAALQIPESVPVVLFAGRLSAQKQPRVLAETARTLRDGGSEFVFLAAGDGPEYDSLRSLVREHALERTLRLLGPVPPGRVHDLLTASDVFFLPSRYEGIALTLYEAMAAGVVPVAADVGGQRELVTPECGALIARSTAAGEVAAYASVLRNLFVDVDARRRMAQHARERVRDQFSLGIMAGHLEAALNRARLLHETAPRAQPSVAKSERKARRALREAELLATAAARWQKEERTGSGAYAALARLFGGWYAWGVARGWQWLRPLRARIRLMLLGRS